MAGHRPPPCQSCWQEADSVRLLGKLCADLNALTLQWNRRLNDVGIRTNDGHVVRFRRSNVNLTRRRAVDDHNEIRMLRGWHWNSSRNCIRRQVYHGYRAICLVYNISARTIL